MVLWAVLGRMGFLLRLPKDEDKTDAVTLYWISGSLLPRLMPGQSDLTALFGLTTPLVLLLFLALSLIQFTLGLSMPLFKLLIHQCLLSFCLLLFRFTLFPSTPPWTQILWPTFSLPLSQRVVLNTENQFSFLSCFCLFSSKCNHL